MKATKRELFENGLKIRNIRDFLRTIHQNVLCGGKIIKLVQNVCQSLTLHTSEDYMFETAHFSLDVDTGYNEITTLHRQLMITKP
jgi:hypothetical protein